MATATRKKIAQSSPSNKKQIYITDKKALKYIEKHCEKALSYCQQEGLTSFEEFAATVEAISEAEGKNGKINAEINGSGVIFSLKNHPRLGTVTGKYLMKNLGYDEEKQSKFTKQGVEEVLDSDLENEEQWEEEDFDETPKNHHQLEDEDEPKSNSAVQTQKTTKTQNNKPSFTVDSILDALDEEEFDEEPENHQSLKDEDEPQKPPTQKKRKNSKTQNRVDTTLEKLDEIDPALIDDDEFLEAETSSPHQDKPNQSQNSQTPNKQPQNLVGKMADILTDLGEEAMSNDLDGLTIGGAGSVITISAATILGRAFQNAIQHLDDEKDQQALKETSKRILEADKQAEEFATRAEEIANQLQLLNKVQKEEKHFNNPDETTELTPHQNPLFPFAAFIDQLNQKIEKSEDILNPSQPETTPPKSSPLKIDPSSDFKTQLKQINKALDKIEERLENLETKISELEEQIAHLHQNINAQQEVTENPLTSSRTNSSRRLDKIVEQAKTEIKNLVNKITRQQNLEEEEFKDESFSSVNNPPNLEEFEEDTFSSVDNHLNLEEEEFEEDLPNNFKTPKELDKNMAENLLTLHTHLENSKIIQTGESLTLDASQNIKSSAYLEGDSDSVIVEITKDDRILFQAEKFSQSPNSWRVYPPDYKLSAQEKQILSQEISHLNRWANEQNPMIEQSEDSPLQNFMVASNNRLKPENQPQESSPNRSQKINVKREQLEM